MQTFNLPFDTNEQMFIGQFQNISRDFILFLKKKGFLENVTQAFINKIPEKIDGILSIDPQANTEDSLWIFFSMTVEATDEMKTATQQYLDRDIEIDEKNGKLLFNIFVPKTSIHITKSDEKEIILYF